jgi:hypothetical protein
MTFSVFFPLLLAVFAAAGNFDLSNTNIATCRPGETISLSIQSDPRYMWEINFPEPALAECLNLSNLGEYEPITSGWNGRGLQRFLVRCNDNAPLRAASTFYLEMGRLEVQGTGNSLSFILEVLA